MMASSTDDFLDASEDLLASSSGVGYSSRTNQNESEDILASSGSRSRSQDDLIQSDDEEEEELSTKEVIQRMQVSLQV